MTRPRSVMTKVLWQRWRGLLGWSLGISALAAITVAFYPAIVRDAAAFTKMIEAFPRSLLAMFGTDDPTQLLTAVGFVNSRIYASIGAVLVLVFAIGIGASAIAGEEDAGTLEVLLSQPITRRTIVLESAAALALLVGGVVLAIAAVVAAGNEIVGLGLSWAGIAATNVGLALLAIFFGTVALAIGASTGRRGFAIGVTAAIVAATFFVNSLAPLIDSLRWAQKLSPFAWYLIDRPLATGFSIWFLALVFGIVALLAVAVWGFERRDVAA